MTMIIIYLQHESCLFMILMSKSIIMVTTLIYSLN